MSLNKVLLLGTLPSGPTSEGLRRPRCRFTLAVSSVAYGYKGAKTIRTDLVPLLAFGRTAADCIARLVQGSRIMVDGHLHEDRWDVGRGASRSRLLVVADHVHFLSDPLHRGFRPTTDLSQKSMATRFASSY